MQKNILLFLFLAVSVFLFAPTNKAEAANYGCHRSGQACIDVTADNAEAAFEACCPPDVPGVCRASSDPCPEPREYGCVKNGKCENITAVDYESAAGQCRARCDAGDGVDEIGTCVPSTEPCRLSPLEGATVEALKKAAVKDLNKANFKSPEDLINRAIRILMAFIGSISLVLYIYSGFLWMTARGNSDQTGKAKLILVWTTLGVVIMLSSYMLASFIFKSLGV